MRAAGASRSARSFLASTAGGSVSDSHIAFEDPRPADGASGPEIDIVDVVGIENDDAHATPAGCFGGLMLRRMVRPRCAEMRPQCAEQPSQETRSFLGVLR